MAEFDVVVAGGTVVDGTGAPPRTADVAIADGRIVAVGDVEGTATRTIDADGAVVVARCDDGGHGQLRRGLRASAPRRPPAPHRAHGGRGGHPRRRPARGP